MMNYFAFNITERIHPQELDVRSCVLLALEPHIEPSDLLNTVFVRWRKQPMKSPWRAEQPSHTRMGVTKPTLRQIEMIRVDYRALTEEEFHLLSSFHPIGELSEKDKEDLACEPVEAQS